MAYELTGSCSKCGDCCACRMIPSAYTLSRKNLITIERNGEDETMLYCDYVRLVDGEFICKLFAEYAKVAELDLTKPLDDGVVTEEIRENITSDIEGVSPISRGQVVMCCHTANFPFGIDLDYHSKESKYIPGADKLHELCPNCTYQIVEVPE